MLNFEDIGDRFTTVISTEEWIELQQKFNDCDDIYVLGHGGNLAVADHAAVDITRLSNGTKNAICPSSAVVATSYINDTSFDQWMVSWLSSRTSTRTKDQMRKSLVLGISSSGTSTDVLKALQWASDSGMHGFGRRYGRAPPRRWRPQKLKKNGRPSNPETPMKF